MIRALITLATAAFFLLCLGGMRLGWKRRGSRQTAIPQLPPVPQHLGAPLLPPMTGLYVGTTSTASWQDRIVAHGLGLRASFTAGLTAAGLLIDREGADAIFIPATAIVSATLGAGLAGKVVGAGGLLVVRWRVGGPEDGIELDTGLRADDKSTYPDWVRAIDQIGATI